MKNNKSKIFAVGITAVIILVLVIIVIIRAGSKNIVSANERGNVLIDTSEVSSKAVYYTYDYKGTEMVFFAVKDSNGRVRLAFDRCQVCYDSGKGYFLQTGDEFVCQNCGNRYKLFTIGTERGGCNPSPITNDDRNINGDNIEIFESVFEENRYMFRK